MLRTFRTNINCGSCLSNVTPFLDEVRGVSFWRVDTEDERKLLFVEGTATQKEIEDSVRAAGYDLRLLSEETN